MWNDSQVHKGQARFLGNPAIWGHIRTGAELRPEKLTSHLRPVFGCTFGDGDGPFLVGGVIVAEQWLGEQSSPCSPQPFLLPPLSTTQGGSALRFPTPSPPLGVSARLAQLPFQSPSQFLRLPATCWRGAGAQPGTGSRRTCEGGGGGESPAGKGAGRGDTGGAGGTPGYSLSSTRSASSCSTRRRPLASMRRFSRMRSSRL